MNDPFTCGADCAALRTDALPRARRVLLSLVPGLRPAAVRSRRVHHKGRRDPGGFLAVAIALVLAAGAGFATAADARPSVLRSIPLSAAATSVPAAPSHLGSTIVSPTSVILTWTDHSGDESGFRLYRQTARSGEWIYIGSVPTNTTGVRITLLVPGTFYQFAVRAYNGGGSSAGAETSVTLPGITSRGYHPATVGQPLSYAVTASTDGGAPTNLTVTGELPPGLSYAAATRQITGVPSASGVFSATLWADYSVWGTLSKTLSFRVIHGPGSPVARAAIPAQVLSVGGPAVTVPLATYFADRDTERAVRFSTASGDFSVALYASATPQTVSNFLQYVNRGAYSGTVVHRCLTNFVVQGGGYQPAPPNFTRIPRDPSPTNEPGISNLRGTVAMAKLGGNPDSATSEWFINLSDNSANLDNQNGGFTAFGRVCGPGMAIADAIARLPRGEYTVNVDGQSALLKDWPMDTPPPAPAVMDQALLVRITTVTPLEPLAYAITGDTNAGLVAGTMDGSMLTLSSSRFAGGQTLLTVTATDLDGNSTSQALAVTVESPYSAWAAGCGLAGDRALPEADADHDGLTNAGEFVLAGVPTLADSAAVRPVGSVTNLAGSCYAAVRLKLRKALGGAELILEGASAYPANPWLTVWTSAELDAPVVVHRSDAGDHWELLVRDSIPLAANGGRFLRVRVRVP